MRTQPHIGPITSSTQHVNLQEGCPDNPPVDPEVALAREYMALTGADVSAAYATIFSALHHIGRVTLREHQYVSVVEMLGHARRLGWKPTKKSHQGATND